MEMEETGEKENQIYRVVEDEQAGPMEKEEETKEERNEIYGFTIQRPMEQRKESRVR